MFFPSNINSFTVIHRHHLESSFLKDSVKAIEEADVIGVVHDISNRHTKLKLDEKVLRLLFMYPLKHVFLVLNKVIRIYLSTDFSVFVYDL